MLTRFATFSTLHDERYVNLTTFRKNGNAVPTPVWCAQDMWNGILYVETSGNSGKVKRIRHTSKVTLAPCTVLGKTTGDVIEGKARIVTETAERFRARGALHHKYGLQRQFFYFVLELIAVIRRKKRDTDVYIAIEPAE